MKNAFRFGRIAGVEVGAHWTWLRVLASSNPDRRSTASSRGWGTSTCCYVASVTREARIRPPASLARR
jgi:hypothetical protein